MTAEYIKSIMQPYNFKIPPPEEMKVIVEILEIFKKLPCLWDTAHQFYHSRQERDRAYKILVDKFKTMNPDATRETVKRKLDNMRNAYKREYKKVIAARLNGRAEHIPVLWYYHHLTFLDESREDTDYNSTAASEITETAIKIEEEIENEDTIIIEDNNETAATVKVCVSPSAKRMRFSFEEPVDTEVTQSLQDDEDSNQSLNSNLKKSDVHDIASETFGRTVGLQLQELEPMQRFIAEKLISEVIFFGRLRKLNTATGVTINNCNSNVNKSS